MNRAITIYIDENLPPSLARGLNELQQPQNSREKIDIQVLSLKNVFGEGIKDEEWIPKVGKENGIVITQDNRIQTQRHQKELYLEHGVGIFFMSPPSKTGYPYWEIVKKLINHWEEIKGIILKNERPFAYRCTQRSKFERLEV